MHTEEFIEMIQRYVDQLMAGQHPVYLVDAVSTALFGYDAVEHRPPTPEFEAFLAKLRIFNQHYWEHRMITAETAAEGMGFAMHAYNLATGRYDGKRDEELETETDTNLQHV